MEDHDKEQLDAMTAAYEKSLTPDHIFSTLQSGAQVVADYMERNGINPEAPANEQEAKLVHLYGDLCHTIADEFAPGVPDSLPADFEG
jgi:hypothetical protein